MFTKTPFCHVRALLRAALADQTSNPPDSLLNKGRHAGVSSTGRGTLDSSQTNRPRDILQRLVKPDQRCPPEVYRG